MAGGTSNRWDLEGKVYYEVCVDDDEPEFRAEFKQRYPFQKQMEKALCSFVTEKFKVFVSELSAKGNTQAKEGFAAKTESRVQVGQYQKYEQVSPIPNALPFVICAPLARAHVLKLTFSFFVFAGP